MITALLAQKIQDSIRAEKRYIPTLQDIMFRMTLVPAVTSDCVPVYSMQVGDLTILTALFYDQNGQLVNIRSKCISW